MKKKLAILGSTGSIGTQALEVVTEQNHLFEVELLTANSNYKLLAQQAVAYNVELVIIADEQFYLPLKALLENTNIKVAAGPDAIVAAMKSCNAEIILTAMVGYAGLKPTVAAIEAGKHIALANKETLVVAGEIIMNLAKKHHVGIYPVDSEHSAIFQCLVGEEHNPIEKIYLTASGGPFRGRDYDFLKEVTKAQALKHPNWEMGAKITIDSATLMNKGLEAIEAKWLFGLQAEQIDVIVHPQSIVHSIVQFTDGSMKAQMGLPDMKLPIQYALAHPQRIGSAFTRFNFMDYPQLTFEKADTKAFRNLNIAYKAMETGGIAPCLMNAANEAAVAAFLKEKIGFTEITDIIEETMVKFPHIEKPNLNDYFLCNEEAFNFAANLANK